jgi:hypothetical protein
MISESSPTTFGTLPKYCAELPKTSENVPKYWLKDN